MLKEPLLFCVCVICTVRECGLRALEFKQENGVCMFDFAEVFDCVPLCGRKPFRAARNCIFRENVLY